jgi:DNA modification methylase
MSTRSHAKQLSRPDPHLPAEVLVGDNLHLLRSLADETVDLVYSDPPYNSGRDYFHGGPGGSSEVAYSDKWPLSEEAGAALALLKQGGKVERLLSLQFDAWIAAYGRNSKEVEYLAFMAPRLVELHRVLRKTGSLYLQCDPTSSHLLRTLLDVIFGSRNFRGEIVWKRTFGRFHGRRPGAIHDTIFFYTKSGKYVWNDVLEPAASKRDRRDPDGRRWVAQSMTGARASVGDRAQPWRGICPPQGRSWWIPRSMRKEYRRRTGGELSGTVQEKFDALDRVGLILSPKKAGGVPTFKCYRDMQHRLVQDIWDDVRSVARSKESLKFGGQKPIALLERIIGTSSNPGDTVLDAFLGTGTTGVAAAKLGRGFLGLEQNPKTAALARGRLGISPDNTVQPSTAAIFPTTNVISPLLPAAAGRIEWALQEMPADFLALEPANDVAEDGPAFATPHADDAAVRQGAESGAVTADGRGRPVGRKTDDRRKAPASAFILSLPPTLSPAAAVALGKAQGVVFTTSWVGQVRKAAGLMTTKGAGAATAASVTTTPAKPPLAGPKRASVLDTRALVAAPYLGTKKSFVLAAPRGAPAAFIVAKGREVGVELTVPQIHSIRSRAKAKAKSGDAAPAGTVAALIVERASSEHSGAVSKSPPAEVVRMAPVCVPLRTTICGEKPVPQDIDIETAFMSLVIRIGVGRAEHIVAGAKHWLESLMQMR